MKAIKRLKIITIKSLFKKKNYENQSPIFYD